MESYKGLNILIVGMGKSGISAAKLLLGLGANVYISDSKSKKQLSDQIGQLKGMDIELLLGCDIEDRLQNFDLMVLSPGVPLYIPLVKAAVQKGIEIIGEIELAYRMCRAPIIAITGTNGKTTTTMLVGEILKAFGLTTHVVGNIGLPFIDRVMDIDKGDIVVLEASSYQLETINMFKPHIASILNISEDHLDRHKTMKNYIDIKGRIFENQTNRDYMILNADDEGLHQMQRIGNAKLFEFSREKRLHKGAWIENGKIIIDIGKGREEILDSRELFILGSHNLENALAASLMTAIMGVDSDTIAKALKEFRGVEHRIEYVDTIEDIVFYNDSKGTNPDASIKAIEAMDGPTIIIAGGLDEGAHFDELIDSFKDKILHMVVLGDTAKILMKIAEDKGFFNVHKVDNMQGAVKKAFELSKRGYRILLSPACASFDMYKSFEQRGDDFKRAVRSLRG